MEKKRHRDLENTCSARTLQGMNQFPQGSGSKNIAALTKIYTLEDEHGP